MYRNCKKSTHLFSVASVSQCNYASSLKGRVQCFSMQVVINKCFLLNPEKKFGTYPSCRYREKRKKRTL